MDAKLIQGMQFSKSWMDSDHFGRRNSGCSLQFSRRLKEKRRLEAVVSIQLRPKNRLQLVSLDVSCSYQHSPASIVETGTVHASSEESLILKTKSQEVQPYLSGRCIYLVGMMGSGKTTVGKVLSEVLGYSFCDCDKLIEEDVDGTSVSEIFKLYGEGFFRMKETEILKKLSMLHRMVVSTGGGAVIRPINWEYMQKGISVWLDVPLEALAKRIAAVGTHSRPLLHHESGDPYTKALTRLSTLFEEREEYYANANARVSVENIAAKLGYRDISTISPTTIAIEALEQIENYLEEEGAISWNRI